MHDHLLHLQVTVFAAEEGVNKAGSHCHERDENIPKRQRSRSWLEARDHETGNEDAERRKHQPHRACN